ncbi:MAG: transglutaminase domain-containing protein [Opitutaceae bacterium]|nr:transglutaminase domain-containing protein [Opitutaceae bacterium]
MNKPLALASLLAASLASTLAASAVPDATTTYRVRQTARLTEIPAGARQVNWWIAIPDDERHQDVLDLTVTSAPGTWRIVTEPDRANRFLLVEVTNPGTDSLAATVEFTLRRQSVFVDIDPAKSGPITETHRRLFVDELRQDAPYMAVTPTVRTMADGACGAESNVARQVALLLAAVADRTNHYSIDSTVPKCSPGDAEACMEKGGGCCTDLHALFIACARARGIPARLQMGYRLREPNAGKEVDPGYRCWAEYFIPGYGWVPTDIVEADDPKGLGRARWFSGLTERRLWLNSGREFDLPGRAVTSHRVNTVVVGYAEIDGKEVRVIPDEAHNLPAQITRTVLFTEIP